jgi:hypothetical protein
MSAQTGIIGPLLVAPCLAGTAAGKPVRILPVETKGPHKKGSSRGKTVSAAVKKAKSGAKPAKGNKSGHSTKPCEKGKRRVRKPVGPKISISAKRKVLTEQAVLTEYEIPQSTVGAIEEPLPAVCEMPVGPALVADHEAPAEETALALTEPPSEHNPLGGQDDQAGIELLARNDTLAGENTDPPAEKAGLFETVDGQPATLQRSLMQVWNWIQLKFQTHQVKKRLRVCESVSLGEKRFIAVVQVDGEQFLVGGSSSSISTLARLDRPGEFPDLLRRRCEQDLSQA